MIDLDPIKKLINELTGTVAEEYATDLLNYCSELCDEVESLRAKYELLLCERGEVGEACDRMENTWKAYAEENKRIHMILEEMAQKRHGIEKGEDATETLTNVIDNALALIWANKT